MPSVTVTRQNYSNDSIVTLFKFEHKNISQIHKILNVFRKQSEFEPDDLIIIKSKDGKVLSHYNICIMCKEYPQIKDGKNICVFCEDTLSRARARSFRTPLCVECHEEPRARAYELCESCIIKPRTVVDSYIVAECDVCRAEYDSAEGYSDKVVNICPSCLCRECGQTVKMFGRRVCLNCNTDEEERKNGKYQVHGTKEAERKLASAYDDQLEENGWESLHQKQKKTIPHKRSSKFKTNTIVPKTGKASNSKSTPAKHQDRRHFYRHNFAKGGELPTLPADRPYIFD